MQKKELYSRAKESNRKRRGIKMKNLNGCLAKDGADRSAQKIRRKEDAELV